MLNNYTLTVTNGTPSLTTQDYRTTLQVTAATGTTYTISFDVNEGDSETPDNSISTKPFSSWGLS
jgi:hypothetical protein